MNYEIDCPACGGRGEIRWVKDIGHDVSCASHVMRTFYCPVSAFMEAALRCGYDGGTKLLGRLTVESVETADKLHEVQAEVDRLRAELGARKLDALLQRKRDECAKKVQQERAKQVQREREEQTERERERDECERKTQRELQQLNQWATSQSRTEGSNIRYYGELKRFIQELGGDS